MNETHSQKEIRIERFIAVIIAITTIFISGTAFMEKLASNESERLERIAHDLSIQATTARINGSLKFSYDWQGAFQTWYELDLMIINAEQNGDFERADLYLMTRDRINQLSKLLQAPYYDPEEFWTDSLQYESDLYIVESTRLWEQYENISNESNTWDEVANSFVLQLTFYAVALSLMGLSATLQTRIRWLFIFLASAIVLINVFWAAIMFLTPFDEIPEEAINAYAEGSGLSYQGRDEEAIESFTRALEIEPEYTNAIYDRGFSKLIIGDYEGAAEDFETALASGRDDTSLLWNLGWTYYLLGRFDEAVLINQQALSADPSLIGVRMNQGLVMFAQGRVGNAITEYDKALEEAVDQVSSSRAAGEEAPASLWFFMEAGAQDLESLLDSLKGTPKPWALAPSPIVVIASQQDIEVSVLEQAARIKEYTVSLEFFGTPPSYNDDVEVFPFEFIQRTYDEFGEFVEFIPGENNPFGVNEVSVRYAYRGFKPDSHVVWKIYSNGFEDTALRDVYNLNLEGEGTDIKDITYAFSNVFIFSSGEYSVELYIDSKLVQQGNFWIAAEE